MVIWTARARADLKAIHDYIAKDSPINAKRVVREMQSKAAGLAETPLIGHVVPEVERHLPQREALLSGPELN